MTKEADVVTARIRNSAKRAEVHDMLETATDDQKLLSLELLLNWCRNPEQTWRSWMLSMRIF